MAGAFRMDDARDHFAHCVQVLGGVTTASRRLGIDERAIRRFINGERPFGARLLEDTASALRQMTAEAEAANAELAALLAAWPGDPQSPRG